MQFTVGFMVLWGLNGNIDLTGGRAQAVKWVMDSSCTYRWSFTHLPATHPLLCSSAQSLSHVRLSAIPWTAARQASLSITNSWSLPKAMSIESVMPSNHLILCRPSLLLPSIFPSIRVFSNESGLCIRWPKYCSFSFNIRPSNQPCPTLCDPHEL